MNRMRRGHKLLVLAAASTLVIAACGSDDGDDTGDTGYTTKRRRQGPRGRPKTPPLTPTETDTTEAETDTTEAETDTTEAAGGAGGEFIDLGTFVGDPPEHIDPALNSTLDAYQVINAVYDGLTEIDATDPANPQIVPLVAETVESNEDASVWTFTIKEGAQFADGEEINASTFQNSWSAPPISPVTTRYLLTFIEGGAERLDGTADTISGVVADDATRTLTVTLSAPYSNFDAVAGFQLFMPGSAGCHRGRRRLGERRHVRQRPVPARSGAHRRRDRARSERELAG